MADDASNDLTPETAGDEAGATAIAEPTAAVQPTTLALGDPNPTPDEPDAPAPRPLAEPARRDAGGFVWGTGRRKTAVARVRLRPTKNEGGGEGEGGGGGEFIISSTKAKNKTVDEFFSEPQHRIACRRPQEVTGLTGKMDVYVNVKGGGITGQAEAVLLGVARALKGYDPTLEQTLRDNELLTRDSRKVERKKYGQAGARRRFQFSKR